MPVPEGPRQVGTFTKKVEGRGYGFLVDATGKERFLHRAACLTNEDFDQLQAGDRVEFEPFEHVNGSRAVRARRLG